MHALPRPACARAAAQRALLLGLAAALACGQRPASDQAAAEGGTATAAQPARPADAMHSWCEALPEDFLLTPEGFGPLVPGATEADIEQACFAVRDTTWFDAEGNEVAGIVLQFGDRVLGVAQRNADGSWWASLTHPSVVTPNGIRVGSTVGEIRQALGSLAAGYDDEGVYVWSETAEPRISYIVEFDVFSVFPAPDRVAEAPERIPDSARVERILFSTR